jgi:hypothetical protein
MIQKGISERTIAQQFGPTVGNINRNVNVVLKVLKKNDSKLKETKYK